MPGPSHFPALHEGINISRIHDMNREIATLGFECYSSFTQPYFCRSSYAVFVKYKQKTTQYNGKQYLKKKPISMKK
jgi:hypothetical protein